MKIRNDFVTNSSSSSFILARKDECTYDEIDKLLQSMRSNVKDAIRDFRGYRLRNDEISDKDIEDTIDKLTDFLFEYPRNNKLDSWTVSSIEAHTDSIFEEYFLCVYGEQIQTSNFKVLWRR